MASLRDIEAHRDSIAHLAALAESDLAAFWRELTYTDLSADEIAKALRSYLPDLVGAYEPGAAELGASFYEELRDAAGAAGGFTADLAPPATVERVDALAGFGLSPIFAGDTPDLEQALSLLTGGVQRIVSGAGRRTIERNVARDHSGPVYARHARAGACAFCALLATQDAVYGSEAAAKNVIGRGATRRPRGTQPLGHKYHDWCHCVAVPVWPGQQIERAPYVDTWEAAYSDAPHGDITEVLAHMRQSLGVA